MSQGVASETARCVRLEDMIIKWIHADHALTDAHKRLVESKLPLEDAFFILHLWVPEALESLPCGLYGPLMGDDPVPSEEVVWKARPGRSNLSRLVRRSMRKSRALTVIGTRTSCCPDESEVFIWTAYGGPLAPREITDPTLPPSAIEESVQFWAQHALVLEEA